MLAEELGEDSPVTSNASDEPIVEIRGNTAYLGWENHILYKNEDGSFGGFWIQMYKIDDKWKVNGIVTKD